MAQAEVTATADDSRTDPCAELLGKTLFVVPEGLKCLLHEMSREVLLKRPSNIPLFLAEFLEGKLRQSGYDPRGIDDYSTRNPMDKPWGDPVNADSTKVQERKDEERTNIGGPSGEFAPPDSANTGTTPGVQPTTNMTSEGVGPKGQGIAQFDNPQAPFGYGPDGKTPCAPYGLGKNGLPLTAPDPLAPFGYHPSDGLPLATNDPTAPFGFSVSGNVLTSRDPKAPLGYDVDGRANSTPETIAFCGDSVQNLEKAGAAADESTTAGQQEELRPPGSLRQGNDEPPPSYRKEQGNGVQLVDLMGPGQQQETQTSTALVTASTAPQPGPGVQDRETQGSLLTTPQPGPGGQDRETQGSLLTTPQPGPGVQDRETQGSLLMTNPQNSIALTCGALNRQSGGSGGVMYIGGPGGSMILNYDPCRVNPVHPPISHMANACTTGGPQAASQVGVIDCAEAIRQAVEGMLTRVMSMMAGIMSQNQQCAPLVQNTNGIIQLCQPQIESGNSQQLPEQQPEQQSKQQQIPFEPTTTTAAGPVSNGKVVTSLGETPLDMIRGSGNVGGSSNSSRPNDGVGSEPMVGTLREGQPETGSTRMVKPVPAQTGCESVEIPQCTGSECCCQPICCCRTPSEANVDQFTTNVDQSSNNSKISPNNSEKSTNNSVGPPNNSEKSGKNVDQSSNDVTQPIKNVDDHKPQSTTAPLPPPPSSKMQTDAHGKRKRCIPEELRPYVPGEACGSMATRTPPPIPPRLRDPTSIKNDIGYIEGIVVRAAGIMKTACGTGSGLAVVKRDSGSTMGANQPSSSSAGDGGAAPSTKKAQDTTADCSQFSELEGLCNGAGLEAFKNVGKQLQELAPHFQEQFGGHLCGDAETTLNLLTTVGVLLDTIEDTGLTQMDPVLMCSNETLDHLTDVSEKLLIALHEHLVKLAAEPPSSPRSVENGMAQIAHGAHEALCLAAESLEVAVGILKDAIRECANMKEHPELLQKCAADFAAAKKLYEEGPSKSFNDDGTSPEKVVNGHAATQASQGLGSSGMTSGEDISDTGNDGFDNPKRSPTNSHSSGPSSDSQLANVRADSGPTPLQKYGSSEPNNSNSDIITRQLSKAYMAGDDEDDDRNDETKGQAGRHLRPLYNSDKLSSSDQGFKRPSAAAAAADRGGGGGRARSRTSLEDLTMATFHGDNWSGNVGRFMTSHMTSVQNLLNGQTPLSEARGQIVFLTVSFVIGVIVGYAVSRSVGFFGLGYGSGGPGGSRVVSARAIEAMAATTSSRVAAAASPSPMIDVHGVKCSIVKGAGCACKRV